MIQVEGLRKHYGEVPALDGVTFRLEPGRALVLLGPNGAGKSTVLKCLLGLVWFDGEVRVDGLDARRQAKDLRRRVGYVPQMPVFHDDLTALETARFYAQLRGEPAGRAREVLDLVRLGPHAGKRVDALSGGMRQRLALGIALLSDPPVLLLDEPFASLDAEGREMFREWLAAYQERGKTLVATVHSLDELTGVLDRALVLDGGRVTFDGDAAALMDRVAGQARLVLRLEDPADAPAALDALSAAGVAAAAESPDTLVVRSHEREHYRAVAALVRAGVVLRGFRTELPALADALRDVRDRSEEVVCR